MDGGHPEGPVAELFLARHVHGAAPVLGRRDGDERTGLFLDVVANSITGRAADIEYVDMRYSNGFTIGWNNGSRTPVDDAEEGVEEMLALRGEG